MFEEHLEGWLVSAMREKNPDAGHWDRVIELAQTALWYRLLPTECT